MIIRAHNESTLGLFVTLGKTLVRDANMLFAAFDPLCVCYAHLCVSLPSLWVPVTFSVTPGGLRTRCRAPGARRRDGGTPGFAR